MTHEWRAEVQLPWIDPLTSDQADAIMATLPGYGMTIHDAPNSRLSLICDVRAGTRNDAAAAAFDAAQAAIVAAGVASSGLPFQVRVQPSVRC